MMLKRLFTTALLLALCWTVSPVLAIDCGNHLMSGPGDGINAGFGSDQNEVTVSSSERTIEICSGTTIHFTASGSDSDYYSDPKQCDQAGVYFCWRDTLGGSSFSPTLGTSSTYTFTPTSPGDYWVYCRVGDGGDPAYKPTSPQTNGWPVTDPYWTGTDHKTASQKSGDDTDASEKLMAWHVISKGLTGVVPVPAYPPNDDINLSILGILGADAGADVVWSGDGVSGTGPSITANWPTGGLKTVTATYCGQPVTTHILVTNLPDPTTTMPPDPGNGDGGSGAGGDYPAGFGPGVSLREPCIYNNVDIGPGSNGSNCGRDGYKTHVIQCYDNEGTHLCYWDHSGKSNVIELTGWRPEWARDYHLTGGTVVSEECDESNHWDGMITVSEPDGFVSKFRGWYTVPVGPSSVTDPAGNVTTFNMDDNSGGLTSVVLPNGDTWLYTCNPGDNKVTNVVAPDQDSFTSITYVTSGPAAGSVAEVDEGSYSAGTARISTYGHDQFQARINSMTRDGVTTGFTWDTTHRKITYSPVLQFLSSTVYDYGNLQSLTTTITNTDESDSSRNQVTALAFYPDDNNKKRFLNSITDPSGSSTTFNRLITTPYMDGMITDVTTDPDGPGPLHGIKTHFDYYNENSPSLYIKPLHKIECTLLDSNNETFTEAEYTYYGTNNDTYWLNTATDVRGNTTQLIRDPSALWKVTETRDITIVDGQPETHVAADLAYYDDDDHGRALPGMAQRLSIPDIDGSTPYGITLRYDDGAKVRFSPTQVTVDHDGMTLYGPTVHYDNLGQPLSITYADNLQTELGYDALGRQTQAVFHKSPTDAAAHVYYSGNILQTTKDEENRGAFYQYDLAQRLNQVKTTAQGSWLDVCNPTIPPQCEWTYDAFGNVKTTTTRTDEFAARTSNFTYDNLNRCTQVVLPYKDNPQDILGTPKVWYNTSGNVQYTRDGSGSVTLYDYDKLNRLQNIYYGYGGSPDAPPDHQRMYPTVTPDVTYGYEGYTGLVTDKTESTGSAQYHYDYLGRLVAYKPPVPANHDWINYTYNNLGEKTSISTTDYSVQYDYFSSGLLKAVRSGGQTIASYTYNNLGNLATVVYGNQDHETLTYDTTDPRHFLNRTWLQKSDGTTLLDIRCTSRDQSGNPLTITDGTDTTSLSYDAADRLSSSQFPGELQPTNFTYDWVGNRLSGPNTPAYDNADQMTRLTGSKRFHHDLTGALTEVRDDPDITVQRAYSYHPDGSLDTETYPGGSCSNRWFDGRRIGLTIGGDDYTFVNDPTGGMIEEITPAGTVRYICDPDGTPLARVTGGVTQYYHYDWQGSTRLLTGPNGNVTDEYTYGDVFGKTINHTGLLTRQPFQFHAVDGTYTHYQDPNLAETQAGSGFYDPETGRATTIGAPGIIYSPGRSYNPGGVQAVNGGAIPVGDPGSGPAHYDWWNPVDWAKRAGKASEEITQGLSVMFGDWVGHQVTMQPGTPTWQGAGRGNEELYDIPGVRDYYTTIHDGGNDAANMMDRMMVESGINLGMEGASRVAEPILEGLAQGANPYAIHNHHLLPQEFAEEFDAAGIESVDDYIARMPAYEHWYIHSNAGGNWNRVWKTFLEEGVRLGEKEILDQLGKMIDDFHIRPWK